MQERRQNAIRLIFDFLFCRWQKNEKKTLCSGSRSGRNLFFIQPPFSCATHNQCKSGEANANILL